MFEQLTTMVVGVAIILLIVAIWGATIAFVARDTTRRSLTGCQQSMWVILAIVPMVGFAVYLIARPFVIPGPDDPVEARERPKKRDTFLKPSPSDAAKRLATIPAAEYLRAAQADKQRATQQASQGWIAGESEENPTYVLAVTEGPHAGQDFLLDHLPAYIGRGPGCTIRLDNDRGVSRQHAELYQQAGLLRLRDLESAHGTNVNGYDIDDKGLAPGDKVRVGYSLLIVTAERQE
jgi:pSer/pThr/pTyr-binding forkhead associated (FHA) protein